MQLTVLPLTEELSLGSVPGTELTCLLRKDPRLPADLMMALDRSDLEALQSLLIEALILDLQPGQWLHLGYLPNRPLGLIIAYFCDQHGQKKLVLSLHQRSHRWDSALSEAQIASLRNEVDRRLKEMQPEPPVLGEVLDAEGALRIRRPDGQEEAFQRVEGVSHLWGSWREFLQPAELAPGSRVRVTPVQLTPELRAYLRAEVVADRSAPEAEDELCRTGNEKDQLLARGEVYGARSGQLALMGRMSKSGSLDGYLLGKITLSILLGYVRVGDTQAAFQLWTGRFPVPLLNRGHELIEKGQLEMPDLILYGMLSAHLQSMGEDVPRCVKAVNQTMKTVLEHCRQHQPSWIAMVLRNWRLHLMELFGEGQPVPPDALAPWEAAVRHHGRPVLPKVLCFPAPAPWALPKEPAVPPRRPFAIPRNALMGGALVGLFLLLAVWQPLSKPAVYRFDTSADYQLSMGVLDGPILGYDRRTRELQMHWPCKPNKNDPHVHGDSRWEKIELEPEKAKELVRYLEQNGLLSEAAQKELPKPNGFVRIVCTPRSYLGYYPADQLETILSGAPHVGAYVKRGVEESQGLR